MNITKKIAPALNNGMICCVGFRMVNSCLTDCVYGM